MENLINKKVEELIPLTYVLMGSKPKLRITNQSKRKAIIEIEIKRQRTFKEVLDPISGHLSKNPKSKEWYEFLKMKELEKKENPIPILKGRSKRFNIINNLLKQSLMFEEIFKQENGANNNVDKLMEETKKKEVKKNVVEVEVPEGFELKSSILYYSDGDIAKPDVTRIEWKEKVVRNCENCLFINRKKALCKIFMKEVNDICSNWKDKKDLSSTKIWVGDNSRLKDSVISKITNLGYVKSVIPEKVCNLCVTSYGYLTTIPREAFINSPEIEITPQDLEINKEKYTPLFTLYGNTPLYEGDGYYVVNIKDMKLLKFHGDNVRTEFKAHKDTRKPKQHEICFKTEDEATNWIQKQFNTEIQKVKNKYGK